MLIVISPAKTLDFENHSPTDDYTTADFTSDSKQLVNALRQLPPQGLSKLMGISDKLGTLNYDRYQRWRPKASTDNAKQALFAFKGDVYTGLNAESFSARDLRFAQKQLRILSGLYGVLKPLDLMQPYRLEMGTKFANRRGRDLYAFWGDKITDALNNALNSVGSETLINLASQEYFKAVRPARLHARVISPVFKDWKNGQYKIISFYAKQARGLMAAFIVKNRLKQPRELQDFDSEGYRYSQAASTDSAPVFLRKTPPK